MSCNREERMERLAVQILQYARNELLVALRFMDLALCKLTYQAADIARTATDGKHLYFSPQYIFQLYREGGYVLNHAYLHSVFHCVFYHPFIDPRVDQPLWDLACDIAVEGILRELNVKQLETAMDAARAAELDALQKAYGKLTAERLYKSFLKKPPSQKERERLRELFQVDEHMVWYMEEVNIQITIQGSGGGEDQDEGQSSSGDGQDDGQDEDQRGGGEGQDSGQDEDQRSGGEGQDDGQDLYPSWEEISERIKVDLETASQEWGKRSSSLMQNVQEVNRERYDYSGFLRKFAVLGEAMQINDDEFDYIFYTYGLSLYKNIPLIEPLEYKDVKRIREFVIAIDTSGSTSGELVQKFVQKTYNILKSTESFFSKINLHIIQCDADIQEDVKITCQEDFDEYLKTMTIKGLGGTDFRPVFRYVDELICKGEFVNLRGLIYFTDGYGDFPERKPEYETAFVFVEDEFNNPDVPPWAIKLVLQKDEI